MQELEGPQLAAPPCSLARVSMRCLQLLLAIGLLVASAEGCGGSGSAAPPVDAGESADGTEDSGTTISSSPVTADAGRDAIDTLESDSEPGDQEDEHDDAGSGEPSTPDDSIATPEISRLRPEAPAPGEQVTIEGTHFGMDFGRVGVWVGGVPASLVEAGETRLVVTLPPGLELRACEKIFDVVVAVGARESEPVALTVRRRGPVIEDAPATCPAGSELTLGGRGLRDAVVHIGPLQLAPSWASNSELRVTLPRELASGPTSVKVAGDCGSAETELEVLRPIPRLRSIEPLTLAPGGVAYIRADFADRAMVQGVLIGGQRVAAPDPDNFVWPSYSEAPTQGDLFAVRMPVNLPVGPLSLSIESTSGESAPMMIEGVRAVAQHPPADARIKIPPGAAVSDGDGRFPLGTSESDPTLGTGGARWCYAFSNISRACQEGTFVGQEILINADQSCGHYVHMTCRFSSETRPVPLACNLFDGRYRLDGSNNWAEITITRGSVQERYVGGWITPENGRPNWGQGGYALGFLVLRSTRTGLQIVVEHDGYTSSCQ